MCWRARGLRGRSSGRRSAGASGSGSRSCGAGQRRRGSAVTDRDRRALTLGGALVLVGFFLLRVCPWAVRSAVAAEQGLRERSAVLARARADLADWSLLRDSAEAVTRAVVGLAPKLLSGDSPAQALADLS